MGKGSKKKSSGFSGWGKKPTPKRTSAKPYMGGIGGGWGGSYGMQKPPSKAKGGAKPVAKPTPATDWKAKNTASQKALSQSNSRYKNLNSKYGSLNSKYSKRMAQDRADPNRNYQASVEQGNASNTRAISSFNSTAENMTNNFNRDSQNLTNKNLQKSNTNTKDYQNQLQQNLNRQDADSSAETSKYNQGLKNSFNDYSTRNDSLTNQLGEDVGARGSKYATDKNNAYNGYNDRSRALLDKMGTADQDIHTRNRGQAYAGLDSGFGDASDDLQASLARRGMAGSGVGAKSMGDLGQARMRAGAEAGVNAYTSAIDMSDNRRGQRLQGEQNLYGAESGNIDSVYGSDMNNINSIYGANIGANESNYGARNSTLGSVNTNNMNQINSRFTNQNNLSGTNFNTNQAMNNDAYQKGMATLGQGYGNSMAVRGQALQNTLNNNQQRIGNNLGRMQLGRGMAGMSQNYLQQAGSGYTNIAGQAGQTAIGIGGLNNSYNSTMQQAITAKNSQKQEAKGAGIGMAGSALTMFSDERLKNKIQKVGEINGFNIYTWEWNDKAKEIGISSPAFGVIAQEVLVTNPEAVRKDFTSGYLFVDYHKIFGGVQWDSQVA